MNIASLYTKRKEVSVMILRDDCMISLAHDKILQHTTKDEQIPSNIFSMPASRLKIHPKRQHILLYWFT